MLQVFNLVSNRASICRRLQPFQSSIRQIYSLCSELKTDSIWNRTWFLDWSYMLKRLKAGSMSLLKGNISKFTTYKFLNYMVEGHGDDHGGGLYAKTIQKHRCNPKSSLRGLIIRLLSHLMHDGLRNGVTGGIRTN